MGSNSNKKRKETLNKVREIFYNKGDTLYDWMGYVIDEDNFITYHHIIKKSTLSSSNLNDDFSLDNCALLGQQSHNALHIIESKFPKLYKKWNNLFLEINRSRKPLSEEFKNRIADLQIESIVMLDTISKDKYNSVYKKKK